MKRKRRVREIRIKVSIWHRRQLAEEFNTSLQTVRLSLDYYFNSDRAVAIRKRAKELLFEEAAKIKDIKMATRAGIALKTKEGEYRCIYNHWDGYPSYLGKVLLQHYKDKDQVKSLIQKGSFSSIQDDGVVLEEDLYNEPAVITKKPEKFIKDRWGEYMYLYDTDTRWKFRKCGYDQTEQTKWIELTADSIKADGEDEE